MTDRPADLPAHPPDDRHPAPRRLAAFFAGAFCWNLGLGMAHLAVPLYAYSLGWSGVEIGSLVALPVLVQIWIDRLSGAWADRAGGRMLAVLACAATLAAGVLCAAGRTSRCCSRASRPSSSRALFWPATWSLATQFPGDRSRTLGRLDATTSLGQILGTGAAGIALAQAGFPATFIALARVGGVAAGACLLALGAHRPRPAGPRTPLFAARARLARRRSIYYAVLCAYVSGLPLSMSMSFYPILLATHGFSSEASGWLIALRGMGSVATGFSAGRYVTRTADPRAPLAGALAVAVLVLLIAASPHAAPGERGAALALSGLGWGLSHLTTPLVMGTLRDAFGIVAAFEGVDVPAIAWAAALRPLQRWAFRHGRPA